MFALARFVFMCVHGQLQYAGMMLAMVMPAMHSSSKGTRGSIAITADPKVQRNLCATLRRRCTVTVILKYFCSCLDGVTQTVAVALT